MYLNAGLDAAANPSIEHLAIAELQFLVLIAPQHSPPPYPTTQLSNFDLKVVNLCIDWEGEGERAVTIDEERHEDWRREKRDGGVGGLGLVWQHGAAADVEVAPTGQTECRSRRRPSDMNETQSHGGERKQ
jgi:hypothetical protein